MLAGEKSMNKRIEQMMLDATKDMPHGYYVPPQYWEKFAELIVRECADVAQETRWAVPPSQEQIARSIRRHFGVE